MSRAIEVEMSRVGHLWDSYGSICLDCSSVIHLQVCLLYFIICSASVASVVSVITLPGWCIAGNRLSY